MNLTERLMIRNMLLANPDLELDATLSTAVSHLVVPVVDKIVADRTRALEDVLRMLVANAGAIPISGGDDGEHTLLLDVDGDGWNEPESESYHCSCENWSLTWVQVDPERTGRLDPVETALAWRQHVLDTHPEGVQ